MSTIVKPFNIAEHLKSDDDIKGFLEEVACIGDESDLIHAIGIASEAKNIQQAQPIKTKSVDDINQALRPFKLHLGIVSASCLA